MCNNDHYGSTSTNGGITEKALRMTNLEIEEQDNHITWELNLDVIQKYQSIPMIYVD